MVITTHPDRTASPRLRRTGRWLAAFSLVVAVAIPLFTAGLWMLAPADELMRAAGLPFSGPHEWPLWKRTAGLAITAAPLAALVFSLLGARRCFHELAAGRLVSADMARGLKAMACGMALTAILRPVAAAAASVLASLSRPPGQRSLVINLSSDLLVLLVFAAAVFVVAHAMARATAIADDHAGFV